MARGSSATLGFEGRVLTLRYRTESALVGIAALAGVAFGLGRMLRRVPGTTVSERAESDQVTVESAAGFASRRTHPTGRLDSFATGYQTLVAIIEGVAFGALIVTGQNVIFRSGSISQHLTATGQLVTTFAVIAAVTYQYLQLVGAVQWSLGLADTTVISWGGARSLWQHQLAAMPVGGAQLLCCRF